MFFPELRGMWVRKSEKEFIVTFEYRGIPYRYRLQLYWRNANSNTYYLHHKKGILMFSIDTGGKITQHQQGKQKFMPAEFIQVLEQEFRESMLPSHF